MSDLERSPNYLKIAIRIAERIVNGDLTVGQRVSGRSLLAPEYGVSPETIRRALKLLSDMKIVDIKDKSGVYVLSADNAKRYLKNFEGWNEQRALRAKFKTLLAQNSELNRQIAKIYDDISGSLDAISSSNRNLPTYEVRVSPDSVHVGKSIGAIRFWQFTGATIIAIRRAHNLILSPGPYAEIYGGDVIVFVGDVATVQSVVRFLGGTDCVEIQSPQEKEEMDDSI